MVLLYAVVSAESIVPARERAGWLVSAPRQPGSPGAEPPIAGDEADEAQRQAGEDLPVQLLAEAVWYPTALLPSQGVHWDPMDDSSARVSLTDGNTSVALEFRFKPEGFVTSVWSPARYRDVHRIQTPTPWQGRLSAYARHSGMRIPVEGEVEWQLPARPLPYWRGRIMEMAYELAR
jgi:hypothetical protein